VIAMKKWLCVTFLIAGMIFDGCSSVIPSKYSYTEYKIPNEMEYFNQKEYQPTYVFEFKKYAQKYIDLIKQEDNKNITFPLSIEELYAIDKKRDEVKAKESQNDRYKLNGFVEIRGKNEKIKSQLYGGELPHKYSAVFADFMKDTYDMRNEKDILYHWIKIQEEVVKAVIRYDSKVDKKDSHYIYPLDIIDSNNSYTKDVNNCGYRASSNDHIMRYLFQVETYQTVDMLPNVFTHGWNTYKEDGEWWSSDWRNNFIANFSSYIDYSPIEKYKNNKQWLRFDIHEDGKRPSFMNDSTNRTLNEDFFKYATEEGQKKLAEETDEWYKDFFKTATKK
jgi:hypothetical protein